MDESKTRQRVADHFLDEIILYEGKLQTGPINDMGILRLALDLKELRESLKRR